MPVLLILLTYVAVLNAVIVRMLYQRYLAPRAPLPPPPTNATRLQLRARERACDGRLTLAILLAPGGPTRDNDVGALSRLLARARTVAQDARARILLLETADSFTTMHRAWCRGVPACALVFIPDPSRPGAVFRALLGVEPCFEDVALIESAARPTAAFLPLLRATRRDRVTCLAAGAEGGHCPLLAFRLPRPFIRAHAAHAIDILPTAQLEGLAAPPAPLLG